MASDRDTTVKAHETTPLLPGAPLEAVEPVKYGDSVLYRALLCGFMVSMSFAVTQVPLVYVFRLMTCEAYYQTHPDPNPAMGTDRCSIHEIEAGTAKAVSLLGASTTLFGVINLFVTGWMIKHLGIKWGLLISIFWPAVRLAIQNVGVMVGGSKGIIIVQSSQIVTVLGGPGGYVFALNSYITEILEPSRRTGALGMLQGCSFIGTATAYLIGGMISDNFGILAPFRLTLILFLTSCIYVLFSLPSIPPIGHKTKDLKSALADFFGPMKIFTPQKWVLKEGRMEMQYGTILLGIGAFLAVLATGYIPILLQMIATGSYNFSTTENGYLISLNCLIRGLFLSLVFPRLISVGRSYHAKQRMSRKNQDHSSPESGILDLPHTANDFAAVKITNTEGEPIEPTKQHNEQETFDFDLTYARYSLLADGLLTGAATFVSRGWQMYLVSAILPLAAGTGSAAKGTILQMCSPADRADALGAITLVEMIARLVSSSVFGLIFAAFAEYGNTYLVFACNGAVAMIGFCTLIFARFPPDGSKRVEEEILEEAQEEPQAV